jgi:hypothetical protein
MHIIFHFVHNSGNIHLFNIFLRYMSFFQLPYLPELFLSSFDFRGFRRLFRGRNPKTPFSVTDEDLEAFKYNFRTPCE